MREVDAQRVLLVAAFEEADDEGRLLSPRERERASAEAQRGAGQEPGPYLLARADHLAPLLDEQVPGLRRLLAASRLGSGLTPFFIVLALLVGLATNALGPNGQIHVLFAPLLGLVAWNLFIYCAQLAGSVWHRFGRGAAVADCGEALGTEALGARRVPGGGLILRAAGWLLERAPGRSRMRDVKHHAVVGAGISRYLSSWRPVALPLVAARLERLLHLGAFSMVFGAVVGMYVRGLALSYEASWESTFLDAAAVQMLLEIFLGPAATLLGWTIPDVAALEAPLQAASDGVAGGDGALWIHLYAVTGVLFVLLPRMVLAFFASRRVTRLSADLPLSLDARGLRRQLSPLAGESRQVDVVPYSYTPSARTVDGLLALLHDHFGTRAQVRMTPRVDYGAEFHGVSGTAAEAAQRCQVLLFALAQSPEVEVHGRLLDELRAGLPEGEHMLVVIDASGFARRAGAVPGRMDERRRAWNRVVREVGLAAVHVDLQLAPDDSVLVALGASLWPAVTAARA
ncbi:MAG: hypothetical protein ACI9EF_002953 [Pseudohongiellaceae bacterium]|jgi:hypothetical protein